MWYFEHKNTLHTVLYNRQTVPCLVSPTNNDQNSHNFDSFDFIQKKLSAVKLIVHFPDSHLQRLAIVLP